MKGYLSQLRGLWLMRKKKWRKFFSVGRCVACKLFSLSCWKEKRRKKKKGEWSISEIVKCLLRNSCQSSIHSVVVKSRTHWQIHVCSVLKSPWYFETNKCWNPTCFLFLLLRMNRPHHHKRKHTHTFDVYKRISFFREEKKKLEFQFFFLFHVFVLCGGRTKIDLSHRQFFTWNYANKHFLFRNY
jgi:hypothetical protein